MTAAVFIWLTSGVSCDEIEPTRCMERNDYAEKTNDSIIIEDSVNTCDNPGISFDLESDGLEEVAEAIYFHAKE